MVTVHLWSGLRRLTDGAETVEVEANTVGAMLDALAQAHPGVKPVLDAGVSVVIDGQMVPSRHAPVAPGQEIYLMQRLKGG
ncbi:MoaD/ThiS family protein [Tropicibacter naphthalenivorans]|uniref:ThiS family protein n=1 Tax=Tropicibacter naphthalenivorans TaxID=441103 RepID=A0A0P1G720_9RHOB|nr:MoaD/ThiS family protein [Tropicibacter naphthalenivorans]CUH77508.1 ThiS family protein [Tropicibacter naphthalenivorans]SMC56707.1 ThiS family protein [Tropicibacter naphthalenivorans]